jgi:hypothetical protein
MAALATVSTVMKTAKLALICLTVFCASSSIQAQGFVNLNFESTTLAPAPGDFYNSVYFAQAFPGWTETFVGGIETNALYNSVFLDSSGISIVDTNWNSSHSKIPMSSFREITPLFFKQEKVLAAIKR